MAIRTTKKLLILSFLVVGAFFFSHKALAAGCAGTGNCYWVGGTGNANDTTKWATTSGGLVTGSVPTSTDNCNFDAASNATAYTFTVNASTSCLDFNMTGPLVGNVTWAGSSALNIAGSFTLPGGLLSDITRTYTGAITFSSTATGKTLTFDGITMASATTFNGVGGGWTLQDDWNNGSSNITLTNGTVNTNGKAVTAGSFNANNTNTKTITLGATTLTLNTSWVVNGTGTTLTANTSSITVNSNSNGSFSGGSLTNYNNVTLNGKAQGSNLVVSGANSFANLTLTNTANKDDGFSFSGDQTISGTFTANGNSVINRTFLLSNTHGTTRTFTAAVVSISNVDFQDITGAGAGTWSGTSIGNGLGNSGITFATPVTRYWVGGIGNWSDTTHWSTSSGGSTGATVPLPQDTVIFDDSSVTNGQAVTLDMPRLGGDINCNAVNNHPALTTGTITVSSFGNILFDRAMSINRLWQLMGRSTQTLNPSTTSFGAGLAIQADGGTYTLQAAISSIANSNGGLDIRAGTFDANNFNITTGAISANDNATRQIKFGTGLWTVNSSGTIINFQSNLGTLTITPSTSTIKLTDSTSSSKTAFFGAKTYNDYWNATTSTGVVIISDSNTFNNFVINAGRTQQFVAGTTTTITSLYSYGNSSSQITITSSTAATHTISIVAGTINTLYTTISQSIATGGATFNAPTAGGNVDSGSNTGWSFGGSAITSDGSNRYWVGGTGTFDDPRFWALTSGGAAQGGSPNNTNDVYLDGSSGAGTVTVSISSTATKGLIFTGYTGTFAGTGTITDLKGILTLGSGMTWSHTGAITFSATSGTQNITSNGISLTNTITFNGSGGTWQLQDAFITSTTVTLTNGTFDTNAQAMRSTTFALGSGTKVISLNGSTYTLTGTGTVWSSATNGSGFTFTASSTSIIKINNTSNSAVTFAGNGLTYGNIYFSRSSSTGGLTITGTNTFNDFKDDGTGTHTITFPNVTTTLSSFTVSGTSGHLITIARTGGSGTFTLSDSAGTNSVSYLSISNSAATGGATWNANDGTSTNGGNNTGWNFPATSTGNFFHLF